MITPEQARLAANYEAGVKRMYADALDWLESNPFAQPKFQFNFPSDLAVSSALCDALREHFISLDAAAMNLAQNCGWLEDRRDAPTVIMLKIVLKMLEGK